MRIIPTSFTALACLAAMASAQDTTLDPYLVWPDPANPLITQIPGTNRNELNRHQTYSEAVLHHHNIHRSNHSSPPLYWSRELTHLAYVQAKSCIMGRSTSAGPNDYWQNIATGYPPQAIAGLISDAFYNAEVNLFEGQYGKPTPDITWLESFGHFTQVVWAETEAIGCYTYDCGWTTKITDGKTGEKLPIDQQHLTVCNYRPAGNVLGRYADNVKRPKGKAPVVG